MIALNEIMICSSLNIFNAINLLDRTAQQILLVVDHDQKLVGTVTDGDIRRGILSGTSLDESVEKIMNKNPFTFMENTSFNLKMAKERHVTKIPILNKNNVVKGMYDFYENQDLKVRNNKVVLMAGGLGTRLKPLTDNKPKPLLNVGKKPILETIIENFSRYNFKDIYLSVNYRAEMIKDYFGDGKRFGVNIEYIEESQRLGTAGALGLLDIGLVQDPFFVMNGDLLTNVNFEKMLDFHLQQKSCATIGVREYDFQVPFGVVKTNDGYVSSIEEKPVHSFFVSAGMYLLDAQVLEYVPKNQFYDMPTLLSDIISKNNVVSSFPIHEYWIDIGRIDQYERANTEYSGVFSV